MDTDGCYWMAGVSGWEVLRITPEGKLDMVIPFPVERPSKIAFGGADLKTVFVTSISIDLDATRAQDEAGGMFAFQVPGVQGIPLPSVQSTARNIS